MDLPSTSYPEALGLKRNSNDVGWEYGFLSDPKNPDRVKCKLCGKEMGGGVYMIKEHIAHHKGNVTSCPRSSKEDQSKCMKAVLESSNNKRKMKNKVDVLSLHVGVNVQNIEAVYEGILVRSKHRIAQGPMDKFVTAVTPPEVSSGGQENSNDTHVVSQLCARWIYQAGLPFNAIDSDYIRSFCEALGQLGPGWVPPSQCELRETLLTEEEKIVKEKLKSLKIERERNGCSILMDTWSDTKKNVMNLCMNSRGGRFYLSSKQSQTGTSIFEYVDKCIEDVGPEKVVQVITDSADYNLAAAKMLKEKRPCIFWSSCAAHTVNLMFEDIVKLPNISNSIDKAKALTLLIYAHEKTLAMMRHHTKEKDIVISRVTRFATTFLILQSLLENKQQLKSIFISDT